VLLSFAAWQVLNLHCKSSPRAASHHPAPQTHVSPHLHCVVTTCSVCERVAELCDRHIAATLSTSCDDQSAVARGHVCCILQLLLRCLVPAPHARLLLLCTCAHTLAAVRVALVQAQFAQSLHSEKMQAVAQLSCPPNHHNPSEFAEHSFNCFFCLLSSTTCFPCIAFCLDDTPTPTCATHGIAARTCIS
jgi:hypothetical protein